MSFWRKPGWPTSMHDLTKGCQMLHKSWRNKMFCSIDVSVQSAENIYKKATIENPETPWCIILAFANLKKSFITLGHNCFSLLIVLYWKNYMTETRCSTGKKTRNFGRDRFLHYGFILCQMPLHINLQISKFKIIKEVIIAQWWTEISYFTFN